MSKMVKLTIDDKEIEIEEGKTILEAARKVNIDIPTFSWFSKFDTASTIAEKPIPNNGRNLDEYWYVDLNFIDENSPYFRIQLS